MLMKNIKIALLLGMTLVQNSVRAGGGHSKPSDNNDEMFLQTTAVKYLEGFVTLVPKDFDENMPEEDFNTFVTKMTRENDDKDNVKNYFAEWRKTDVLYSECHIHESVETIIKDVPLKKLLATVSDDKVKKEIISKVLDHSIKRTAVIMETPRGPQGTPANKAPLVPDDSSKKMIELILELSKSK